VVDPDAKLRLATGTPAIGQSAAPIGALAQIAALARARRAARRAAPGMEHGLP
jgi:hypothetical protein